MTKFTMPGVHPMMPNGITNMVAVPYLVGQFVMYWSKHERMLANMLARLRGVNYETLRDRLLDGQIRGYEAEMLIDFHALADQHPSKNLLKDVIDEHVSLRELRNDIIHGFWAGLDPDGEYVLKRKTRKADDTSKTVTREELYEGWRSLDRLGVFVINVQRAFEGQPLI